MTTPVHPPQAHAGVKLNTETLDFALRIRGWNRADLARETGYSEPHLSRVWKGLNGASTALVQAIIDAFDGRIQWSEVVRVEEHPDGDEGGDA